MHHRSHLGRVVVLVVVRLLLRRALLTASKEPLEEPGEAADLGAHHACALVTPAVQRATVAVVVV